MITQTIVNSIDNFTQKIKNIPTQTYIIFYIILAVACAIYMFGERRKMVKEIRKNNPSKRDVAIEKFANYKQDLLDEYSLTCQDDIQLKIENDSSNTSNDSKNTLEDTYFNNLFIENLLQQVPNDKIELIKLFLLNPNPDVEDLNLILVDYTKNLLKSTDNFIKENKNSLQFDDTIITNYISLLNANITSYFNTDIAKNISNLIDTKDFDTSNIVDEFVKEVNYRLFFSLRNLSRKVYVKKCDNEKQLTSDDKGLLNQDLSNEIKSQDEYRRNILYVMTYLIDEDRSLRDEVKTEYNKLQNESIQPRSEKVLTNISNASKNLTNSADYNSGKIAGEFDLGNAFANQYNNYLVKQSKNDLDMLINPVNTIDSLEKNTITFLEKIQNKINNNSQQITSKSPATNMLNNNVMTNNTNIFNNQIDTTNRGSLLVKKNSNNKIKNSITLGNSITKNNNKLTNKTINKPNNIIEGFVSVVEEEEDIIGEEELSENIIKIKNNNLIKPKINNKTNQAKVLKMNKNNLNNLDKEVASNLTKTTNSLLTLVNSFIGYLNENVLPLFLDSQTRSAILDLFQQEENSIPFGILLIGLSIMLFFIQVSSS